MTLRIFVHKFISISVKILLECEIEFLYVVQNVKSLKLFFLKTEFFTIRSFFIDLLMVLLCAVNIIIHHILSTHIYCNSSLKQHFKYNLISNIAQLFP